MNILSRFIMIAGLLLATIGLLTFFSGIENFFFTGSELNQSVNRMKMLHSLELADADRATELVRFYLMFAAWKMLGGLILASAGILVIVREKIANECLK